MAFNKDNFAPVGGQSSRAAAPQVFSYRTLDSKIDLDSDGYFNKARTYLEVNDIIIAIYPNGYTEYKVTLVPLNGDIEVTDTRTFETISVKTVTADYTATTSDSLILVDATDGPITITLYTAATSGKQLAIKKIDSSENVVTVDGNGSEVIDGALTFALVAEDESINLTSHDSNWFII